MNSRIPIDSRPVAATRGLVTAARNYGGPAYVDAVKVQTAGLTREELIDVVGLLGCVISICGVAALEAELQ